MLSIDVRVPEPRDRTAVVTLTDETGTIAKGVAVASVVPDLAARRGNPNSDPLRPFGHPPYGTYALLHFAASPPECATEYGSHILVFEPQSGAALEAESLGRLVLLAYAGPTGRDGRPRRTQGGVRFTPAVLEAIVSRLAQDSEVELHLAPLRPRPWWAFWRARPEKPLPLSVEPPRIAAPPFDEGSLAMALLRGVPRPRRRRRAETDRDWDRSRAGEPAGGSSGEREQPFEGRGGASGGAGASEGWAAPASGAARPPGVDASGRIVDSAVAGAAFGAVLGAAAEARDEPPDPAPAGAESDPPGAPDAGTRVSTTY